MKSDKKLPSQYHLRLDELQHHNYGPSSRSNKNISSNRSGAQSSEGETDLSPSNPYMNPNPTSQKRIFMNNSNFQFFNQGQSKNALEVPDTYLTKDSFHGANVKPQVSKRGSKACSYYPFTKFPIIH